MTIKLGSLFDGIGVFPLAAVRCGITPVWASEIEKAPISITKRHFPDMAHLGDITVEDAQNHFGDTYVIEIVNPVEYASYVEYGHRTANHSGWVKGQFMMTISEQELQKIAPKVLENKIKKYLGGLGK